MKRDRLRWVFVSASSALLFSFLFYNYLPDSLEYEYLQYNSKEPPLQNLADRNGWAECHVATRTCHFSNLIRTADGTHYLLIDCYRHSYTRYSGLLLAEGIGSPANYYYIDTWTYLPRRPKNHPIEEKRKKNLDWEMKRAGSDVSFIPIYFVLYEEASLFVDSLPSKIIYDPIILFSVLWKENFFRTIYAVLAAFTTMRFWKIDASVMKLAVLDADMNSIEFARNLNFVAALVSADEGLLFKSVFLGLSSWSLLDEAVYRIDSPGLELRTQAYSEFSKIVKSSIALTSVNNSKPLAVMVQRTQGDRRLLNEREMFGSLKERYGNEVDLQLQDLQLISFREQLSLIFGTKILIAVHGAALAHILFMPKDSFVLEIFPFGFKKTIYRNLARAVGVNYLYYQVPRPSQVRFNRDTIRNIRDVCLKRGEVEWYCEHGQEECGACKKFWRSQDLFVSPGELIKRLELIFPLTRPKFKHEHYLMYMPWEQLNNQMQGFKSACAFAQWSNRTLVLPPVGYWDKLKAPKNETVDRRRLFNPRYYTWRPFERYFELSSELPCKTANWEAITTLVPQIDRILFSVLGPAYAHWKQITGWFYWETAGVTWKRIDSYPWLGRPVHVPRWKIKKLIMPHMTGRIVGMGSMFYFWDFDMILDYPLTRFQDFMHNKLYRKMLLPFNRDLVELVEVLISCPKSPLRGARYDSTHIRRGDYRQKCREEGPGKLPNRRTLLSCHQTRRYLVSRLSLKRSDNPPLFIATNIRLKHSFKRKIVYARDLVSILRVSRPGTKFPLQRYRRAWKTALLLDNVERAIVDQLLCIRAPGIFVGNFFSSFTRAISDHRQLRKLQTYFF